LLLYTHGKDVTFPLTKETIMSEEDRLELILQYNIAFEIMKQYKYTFAEQSYYWHIIRQVEKMLLDTIETQWDVINNDSDSK
jgi:hypothetical protein